MSTISTPSRRVRRPTAKVAALLTVGLALSVTPPAAVAGPAAVARAGSALEAAATTPTVAAPAPASERERRGKRRFGPMRIGVSPGFTILDTTDAQMRSDLRKAKRFGAGFIRIDISWEQVQPTRDVVDWTKTDRLLRAAKARGLDVLAVPGFAPEWGEQPDGSPRPDLFADFLDAAAERYRAEVAVWEIWNEPNQEHRWDAKPDPAAYARLVEAASASVRRRDPGAKILMGALAPAVDDPRGVEISPETFLQGVYGAGIDRSSYDAVSIHPFSFPALPSGDEDWNTFHRLPEIYDLVKRNGDGAKPLWLTEYGARTGSTSRSVSLKRHARLLLDAYREAKKLPFVQALSFYSLRDYAADRNDPEANFGLLKFNGDPKPAYTKVRRAILMGR